LWALYPGAGGRAREAWGLELSRQRGGAAIRNMLGEQARGIHCLDVDGDGSAVGVSRCGASRRLHQQGCWLASVLILVLATQPLVAGGSTSDDTYLLAVPGRSPGIAACSGAISSENCYRVDAPQAPDVCLSRDPDTGACLATQKVRTRALGAAPSALGAAVGNLMQAQSGSHGRNVPWQVAPYASSVPSEGTTIFRADFSQTLHGYLRSCEGGDASCVPDGVHLSEALDWSEVEGAEYSLGEALDEGRGDVFVDAALGSDARGRGTREAPFRSLRAALRRWLVPGACAPWCAAARFSDSATVHVAPGVYAGPENRGLEVHLVPETPKLRRPWLRVRGWWA
jgi:hypothetical protein